MTGGQRYLAAALGVALSVSWLGDWAWRKGVDWIWKATTWFEVALAAFLAIALTAGVLLAFSDAIRKVFRGRRLHDE